MKYRKKPIIVEAVQFTGTKFFDANSGRPSRKKKCSEIELEFMRRIKFTSSGKYLITTLEGNHEVSQNDFIIKGIQGEYYPCKPDIFEQTYERVKE